MSEQVELKKWGEMNRGERIEHVRHQCRASTIWIGNVVPKGYVDECLIEISNLQKRLDIAVTALEILREPLDKVEDYVELDVLNFLGLVDITVHDALAYIKQCAKNAQMEVSDE